METKSDNYNPDHVNLDGVMTDQKEVDIIKAELAEAKKEAQRNAERWVNALKDIANYQEAIKKMVEELGWDSETAIGKIGGYLGQTIFDVIEVNASSKFQR